MSTYDEPKDRGDGWTEWVQPNPHGYKTQCCDCGLVHVLRFRIVKGHHASNGRFVERAQFQVKRDSRSTGQVRRWRNITVTRR